jgi:hypothetical protein
MLSNKALNILAEKIAPKVVDAIFESEEWITLCHDLVPDVVTRELGDLDDDLHFELSLMIMDRIFITAQTK